MDNRDRIARAFVDARRDARGLAAYPGERPARLDDAYAIQDHAIAIDGRQVAGWKVGKINPPLDAELGSNRLAGPIFADQVFQPLAVVSVGGFLGIGAKLVAVPMSDLRWSAADNRWTITGATKESLTSLPAYSYDSARRG